MTLKFIGQTNPEFGLWPYLQKVLHSDKWTVFRAAIAFATHSGTKMIKPALDSFIKKGGAVTITVGVDFGNTTYEALRDLMEVTRSRGNVLSVTTQMSPARFIRKFFSSTMTGRAN